MADEKIEKQRAISIGDGINTQKSNEIKLKSQAERRKMADKLREFDADMRKTIEDGKKK